MLTSISCFTTTNCLFIISSNFGRFMPIRSTPVLYLRTPAESIRTELCTKSCCFVISLMAGTNMESPPTMPPNFWRAHWPDLRRIMACVTAHGHAWRWHRARHFLLNSAGVSSSCPIPANAMWHTMSQPATLGDSYPDVLLMSSKDKCSIQGCPGLLLECFTRLGEGSVRIFSSKGVLSGHHRPLVCGECNHRYYAGFHGAGGHHNSRAISQSTQWLYDEASMEVPKYIFVNSGTAVCTTYLRSLDTRMLRTPFSWFNLAKEYVDEHSADQFSLDVTSVQRILMAAWRIYTTLSWRYECAQKGLCVPPLAPFKDDCTPRGHLSIDWSRISLMVSTHLPLFKHDFDQSFAKNHAAVCKSKQPAECGQTVLVDGNNKLYFSICGVATAKAQYSKWLRTSVPKVCLARPMLKSKTCKRHSGMTPVVSAKTKRVCAPSKVKARGSLGFCTSFKAKRCASRNRQCCNTDRERKGRTWSKTAGVLSAVHPCGVTAAVRPMVRCESRVQVSALLEHLRAVSKQGIVNVGYDDACHLFPALLTAALKGSQAASDAVEDMDFFIDAFHLRGHKRKVCQTLLNPKLRAYGSRTNTQAAEQGWRYLNKHKNSLRFCEKDSFLMHLLWVVKRKNQKILQGTW